MAGNVMVQVNGIEIIFKIGVTSTLVADYLTKDPRAGPGTLSDVHDYAVPPSEELLTTVDGPYLWRLTTGLLGLHVSHACVFISLLATPLKNIVASYPHASSPPLPPTYTPFPTCTTFVPTTVSHILPLQPTSAHLFQGFHCCPHQPAPTIIDRCSAHMHPPIPLHPTCPYSVHCGTHFPTCPYPRPPPLPTCAPLPLHSSTTLAHMRPPSP